MPFRFPQYCYTLPLSVLICHFCNGGNLEIVYIQGLFIHQKIIFYFVYSGVTKPICAKIASRGSEFHWWVHLTLILSLFQKKNKTKKHLAVKCTTCVTCSDKLSLLCFCFHVWLFLVFSKKIQIILSSLWNCFTIWESGVIM